MATTFKEWHRQLKILMADVDTSGANRPPPGRVWYAYYTDGKTPEEAFCNEYPEHHPDSDGPR